MTYRLYPDHDDCALALLQPKRLWAPANLYSAMTQIPTAHGLYVFWLDVGFPDLAPAPLVRGPWALSYIGIARGRRGLRGRLSNHLKGPCRSSTLRRALTALLHNSEGLEPRLTASGKLVLDGEGEAKLSAWLARHARISWIERAAPKALEATLLEATAPPLNVDGVSGDRVKALKLARADLRRKARSAFSP